MICFQSQTINDSNVVFVANVHFWYIISKSISSLRKYHIHISMIQVLDLSNNRIQWSANCLIGINTQYHSINWLERLHHFHPKLFVLKGFYTSLQLSLVIIINNHPQLISKHFGNLKALYMTRMERIEISGGNDNCFHDLYIEDKTSYDQ